MKYGEDKIVKEIGQNILNQLTANITVQPKMAFKYKIC
jgi:hypothetical protein